MSATSADEHVAVMLEGIVVFVQELTAWTKGTSTENPVTRARVERFGRDHDVKLGYKRTTSATSENPWETHKKNG